MSVAASSPFRPVRWEPRIYPGSLRHITRVRADVHHDLKGFPGALIGDVELAVSELHANACRYTASGEDGGEVTRRLSLPSHDRVRLEVADCGWTSTVPHIPERDATDWLTAEGQRGLLLVAALATAWGYYRVYPPPAPQPRPRRVGRLPRLP